VQIYREDTSVSRILEQTAKLVGVGSALPATLSGAELTDSKRWASLLRKATTQYCEPEKSACLRLLALALVVSDAAGSGLRRTGKPVGEWVKERFAEIPLTASGLRETIIAGRKSAIEGETHGKFQANKLQLEAQALPSRAVILSPCGSGKTLAAWMWAEQQLAFHNVTRVIFLYPTRNTATEGFRDYVSWGLDQASLVHGTADYDLDGITFQGNDLGSDDGDDVRNYHKTAYRPEAALFALGYWDKRYISGTVDSFLSFTANRYAADCLLPLLCDSLIVVDEVHSFDQAMFAHLLAFLKHCEAPVLLMTATLPKRFRKELEKLGLPITEVEDQSEGVNSPSRERYAITFMETEIFPEVERWLAENEEEKLLIVCNTVERCRIQAKKAKKLLENHPDAELLVYHSRFRLSDRRSRHEEVIRKFKQAGKRVLLFSTQVCQMSLDLDANTLLTEIAPLPDLIQRMGRTNRRGRMARGQVKIFPVDKDKPYSKEELERARELLGTLPALESVSQHHLAELIGNLLGQNPLHPDLVPLFAPDLFPGLESEEYRQTDDFTMEAILDTDIDIYLEMNRESRVGLTLPVPRYLARKNENSQLPRYLRVASGTNYDPCYGLGDLEREQA
ncbi:MAG: CRISPR-associated helicase Cas3', partial [Candidatus Eremiobacteraeota bacterium]|nr:CRISPR-associated helicase Cas3' [Candidatus Eremiobacteraeota bacterium]